MMRMMILPFVLLGIHLSLGWGEAGIEPGQCLSRFDHDYKVLMKLVELEQKQSEMLKALKGQDEELNKLAGKTNGCHECPDGWIPFRMSCYYISSKLMAFKQAQGFCKLIDAHIVNIADGEEDIFIQEQLSKLKNDKHWIGMSDQEKEGEWMWVDTEERVIYFNWGSGEPNQKRVSNCGAIWRSFNYMWVDESCTHLFSPVCEKPAKRCNCFQ